MTPIKIPLCNDVLLAPPGDDNCADLHIFRDREANEVWSFWRPNTEELAAIVMGGAIALHVTNPTHPPLAVCVLTPEQRDPCEKTDDEVRVVYEANRERTRKLVALMKVTISELAKSTGEKHRALFDEFLDLMVLNTGKCELVRDLNPEPEKA